MTGYLTAEEGPLAGMVIRLDEEREWTLGRDVDVCFQTLEDPMVSRRHILIREEEGGFTAENLSTVNPSLLNGQRIDEKVPLQEGDTLQIGATLFRFSEKVEDEKEVQERAAEPVSTKSDLDSLSLFSNLSTRWMIKVISGPNTGGEFSIHPGESYTIGKDVTKCDIVFHDASVSAEHAKIAATEGGLVLSDLESKNGVFVNGKKLTEAHTLHNQDLVAIGTTSFLAIDREATEETLYTPPPAAPEEEEEVQETATSWKEVKISRNYLIVGLAVAAILIFGIGSVISLFVAKPVHVERVDETKAIAATLRDFPAVEFTYTEATGKLFLVGHVLTKVDKQEMLYLLRTLPHVTAIEDNVVVDEVVWSDMNALIARKPNWRGVTITSAQPGRFIARGYLETQDEAAELSDYLNLNFPYLDKLENQVVVEKTLETELRSLLIERGLMNVTFQLSNGELILAGRVNEKDERKFGTFVADTKKMRGIREVKNFTIITTAATGRIDLTSKYKVTGSSKFGNTNQFVLIDGKILAKGDNLDGMTITGLSTNEVLLEKDGLKFTINYNAQ